MSGASVAEGQSSGASMEVATAGLQYQPLDKSQIRLVRYEQSAASPDSIELRLEHHDIQTAPPYLALSYVWGDPTRAAPITIDSWPFNATQNLFNALKQVRELSETFEDGFRRAVQGDVPLYLWIDAICINQQDIDERASEIPKMTQIYSSAFTVLVWLGTFDDYRSDLSMFGLKLLLNHLDRTVPLEDFERPDWDPDVSLGNMDLGAITRQLTQAYTALLSSEWFGRMWVVQEYALSRRDPCALVGSAMFSFKALFFAVPDLLALGDIEYEPIKVVVARFIRSFGDLLTNAFGRRYMQSEILEPDYTDRSVGGQLLWLLVHLLGKSATVPHDRIYGLLGMVDLSQLPESLAPDYRKPYNQVCIEYTRFIIENTRDLRVMALARAKQLDSGPTWAVDFRYMGRSKNEPAVLHTGFFSEDGLALTLEGVDCGSILTTFCIDTPLEKDASREKLSSQLADTARRLLEFYDLVVCLAATIRELHPSDVWREWFSHFVSNDCRYPRELGEAYHSAAHFLSECVLSDSGALDGTEVLVQLFERQFALTATGEIVQCAQRSQQGPEADCHMYAFKGCDIRSIVCQVGPGEYHYLGGMVAAGPMDEAYFSRNEIVQIKLV